MNIFLYFQRIYQLFLNYDLSGIMMIMYRASHHTDNDLLITACDLHSTSCLLCHDAGRNCTLLQVLKEDTSVF